MPVFTNPYTSTEMLIPKGTVNLYDEWMSYCTRLQHPPNAFFKDPKLRNPTGAELAYAAAFIYQLDSKKYNQ